MNRNEFLDKILKENGIELGKHNKEKKEIVESNKLTDKDKLRIENSSLVLADQLLEKAMRKSLTSAIYESDNSSEEKLNQLKVIESVEFTDDQKEKFVRESIDPIIKASGILEADCIPKYVSGVVYEVALALELAKRGEFEAIKVLSKITEDLRVELQKKEEELSEEISDEEIERDLKELEEKTDMKDKKEKNKKDMKNKEKKDEDVDDESDDDEESDSEMLEQYLSYIFKDWNISDIKQTQLVIENAKSLIENNEVTCLCSDIHELSDMDISPVKNKKDYWNYDNKEEELKEEEIETRIIRTKAENIRLAIQGIDSSKIVEGSGLNKSISAISTFSSAIWKLSEDVDVVVNHIDAIKNRVSTTVNPNSYEKEYNSLINKWKSYIN